MAKTIGFILADTKLGGGERILWMLMNELQSRGYNITIYSHNPDWLHSQNEFKDIVLLSNSPAGIRNKYRYYCELKKSFETRKPNCVICFPLGLAEIAVIAARKSGIPIICSERCDPNEVPEKGNIHRILRKITFLLSSGIVFQTEQVQAYFSKRIQKHSTVIPNPIIDRNLPEIRENRNKEIISTGRLSKEKNFEMLIRAFAQIKSKDYKLTIYGEGPLRQYLENIVISLNLSDRISMPGKVERVIDCISQGDIFVMPSNHEGMPNSLIEGMAMGLAPISTDFASGGARALIEDGVNGFLIPVGDCNALVERLNYLIDNPEEKIRIMQAAAYIRKTNSKDVIIPLWIKYIESLLS